MTKAQILVVEDSTIIGMELEDRLQALGYTIAGIIAYGEEALATVEALQPDLVLMDIRLKGEIDGIEAAAQIQSHFDLPVVYLTAYADDDTLQRAKITGPFGYVVKPFEERDLYTAIEMALYKHRMEKRLRDNERWLAATLQSIGDAVVTTDDKGWVSLLNPAAERLTGWQQKEVWGKRIGQVVRIVHEGSRVPVDPVAEVLEQGASFDLANHLLLARDGQEIPIDGSAAAIQDSQGTTSGAVLVVRDVSHRKREAQEREQLQARLYQAQKAEAIGVLAGRIAHDFYNLMTPIVGYSSLLLSQLTEDNALRQGLKGIQRAGERATALTQQILDLGQKPGIAAEMLDLNTVVADLGEVLASLTGDGTTMVNDLGPGPHYIQADPAQIQQIIVNMVVNAQEAMPEGGGLTLKAETVTLDPADIQHRRDAYPGTFARLSVIDTGPGIAAETLEQIFDPYFTTKRQGAGLGLSIAQNIVLSHQGWIEVHSEPGFGSTFEVYLPIQSPGLDRKPPESLPPSQCLGHGERILIAEDDPQVRAAAAAILQANGYEVVEASNAAQALAAFEAEGGRFNLVFSNVTLPDHAGISLVDELLNRKQDLHVLFTSGYTDQRSQQSLICERGFAYVQKPFDLSSLLAAVHRALHRGDSGTDR